jgi:hypothetical protein
VYSKITNVHFIYASNASNILCLILNFTLTLLYQKIINYSL